ncbi:MAG TPA: hypothetical protein DF984_04440 [Anaerolineaceae bacterium]|nr:hypothetical protein [Anaerolineaceae bacterium]
MFLIPEYYLSQPPLSHKIDIHQYTPGSLANTTIENAGRYLRHATSYFSNLLFADLPTVNHPNISRDTANSILQDLRLLDQESTSPEKRQQLSLYFQQYFKAFLQWYSENEPALQDIENFSPALINFTCDQHISLPANIQNCPGAEIIEELLHTLPGPPSLQYIFRKAFSVYDLKMRFGASINDSESEGLHYLGNKITYSTKTGTLYLKSADPPLVTEALGFWLAHQCLPHTISHGINPFIQKEEVFTLADLLTHFIDDHEFFSVLYMLSRKPDERLENTPTRIWMRLFNAFVYHQTRLAQFQPIHEDNWLEIFSADPYSRKKGFWPAAYWYNWEDTTQELTWNILPVITFQILIVIASTLNQRMALAAQQTEMEIEPPAINRHYLVNQELWANLSPTSI